MPYKKIFFSAVLVLSGLFIVFLSSQVYAGTAALSWNANTESDVSYYKIYYGTASKSGATPCVNAGYPSSINAGKVTSYTISNLTDGATYYFRISAVDASGNESACSAQVSKIIPAVPVTDTSAPTVPSNLSVTAVSSSQINLSWSVSTDNVGVAGYKIYRNGTQVATTTAASYSNTGLSAATSYSYQVSAYDVAGNESVKSTVQSATTNSSLQAGNILVRAKGAVASSVWPQMEIWANGSKIGSTFVNTTAYTDFYFNSSGAIQKLDIVFTNDYYNSTTQEDRNLYVDYVIVNGTKIEAEASGVTIDKGSGSAAFDGIDTIAGQEGIYWLAALRFTFSTTPVTDTSAPTVPSNLSVTAVSSSQINLSWSVSTDNVGVAGYKIYRNGTQVATTIAASYSNTGLSASTNYSYQVEAYDAAGNISPRSASKSIITLATNVLTCAVSSVVNGAVSAYPACVISCNSGFALSGNACVAVVAFGSGGGSGTSGGGGAVISGSCVISSVTNGTVSAYPGCSISCNSGFILQNNSCTIPGGSGSVPGLTSGGEEMTLEIKNEIKSGIAEVQADLLQLVVDAKTNPQNAELKIRIAAIAQKVIDLAAKIRAFTLSSPDSTVSAFRRHLRVGSRGEDVKELQKILARDISIYPEGIISSYYGLATQKAVQKFQCKYNIICSGVPSITGWGEVGPNTRIKLNELFGQ